MKLKLSPLFNYELRNVLRARWLFFYGLVFAAFTFAVLSLGGEPTKVIMGLESLMLLVVPLVSVLYASIYWYNNEAFTQLLLTQPLQRQKVFLARWVAISLSLSGSFVIGTGIPLVIGNALMPTSWLLLGLGTLLSFAFVGLGMMISVAIDDRMKGIGVSLVLWLYCALLHDAVVFFLFSAFREYPVEVPGLLLMASNPIDLARVLLLLALDLSAMMGYTGRILQKTLSGSGGAAYSALMLILWTSLPVLIGTWIFRRKDLS